MTRLVVLLVALLVVLLVALLLVPLVALLEVRLVMLVAPLAGLCVIPVAPLAVLLVMRLVALLSVPSWVGLALEVTKLGLVGLLMVGSCCSTRSYSDPILRKRRNPSASSSASRVATSSSNEFTVRCVVVDISTAKELVTLPGSSTSARSRYFPFSTVSPPAKGCLQRCRSLVSGLCIFPRYPS